MRIASLTLLAVAVAAVEEPSGFAAFKEALTKGAPTVAMRARYERVDADRSRRMPARRAWRSAMRRAPGMA